MNLIRLLVFSSLFLAGVAGADVGDCRDWFAAQQTAVQQAGIEDAGSTPLPGFPHLRTNRWLALLQQQVQTEDQGEQWMDLAARQGLAHWQAVLSRLHGDRGFQGKLESCSRELTRFSAFPGVPLTKVPDHYSSLQRALGIYPLSKVFAQPSINQYRRDMRARFQRPLRRPVRYYEPAGFIGAPPPPSELSVNPLEVPNPGSGATRAMISHYAPILAIAADTPANHIGQVQLRPGPTIDTDQPVAYTWLSWTRYLGHNLLQINYQYWFPERPAASRFDLYSGRLDGLIWRVTLKPDGNVLYYDSIHACGCYHKVYPVARGLRESDSLADAPVFYNRLAPNANQQRIVLALEPDSHFVVAIQRQSDLLEDVPVAEYGYREADELRQLPLAQGGFASLFSADGLIPGSERRERWLLWPLGVPSAGTMRQPGTHAISFIGRRHFDDPDLPAVIFAPPR